MPYDKLLKKIIKEKKKLTYKQVADKCNALDKNNNISSDYIKQLANGQRPAPSEEKSRLLAKALEENEHLLVLEGYIDKAPDEILNLLNNLRKYCCLASLASLENVTTRKEFDIIKSELYKESLSEFFTDFFEDDNLTFTNNKDFYLERKDLKFSFNYNNISFLTVNDDSMYPKIEKDSNVTIEVKKAYINGDILALRLKWTNEILYRFVMFNDDTIILTPLNPIYNTVTYNKQDIEIIGKVSRVIKNL